MSISIERMEFAAIGWADIARLVADGAVESNMLEFKKTLPGRQGQADPWLSGANSVGRYARDELAHELAAFANLYGGTLILGIDESRDTPRKAIALNSLPRCEALAEQLGNTFRSPLIDPPILTFECRALLRPDGDGDGVVILRVASSTLAPHGVGLPPECYVRRGTECKPMGMSEIRSMFWEGRSAGERVKDIRSRLSANFGEKLQLWRTWGVSATSKFPFIERGQPGVWLRCSAIPQRPIAVGPLRPNARWLQQLCPDSGEIGANSATAVTEGGRIYGWVPKAHGLVGMPQAACEWTIEDDGTVSLSAFVHDRGSEQYPGWYAVSVSQLLIMAERIRIRAGRPDVAVEFDADMELNEVTTHLPRGWGDVRPVEDRCRIGPFAWAHRADLPIVFKEIEREIWNAFSAPGHVPEPIDFEEAFKPGSWSGDN